jgi:hypothetical protein
MHRFRFGDEVRVVGPSSQGRDERGTVVEVVERSRDTADDAEECLIQFDIWRQRAQREAAQFMAAFREKLRSARADENHAGLRAEITRGVSAA